MLSWARRTEERRNENMIADLIDRFKSELHQYAAGIQYLG
jgi:hypothetical protein